MIWVMAEHLCDGNALLSHELLDARNVKSPQVLFHLLYALRQEGNMRVSRVQLSWFQGRHALYQVDSNAVPKQPAPIEVERGGSISFAKAKHVDVEIPGSSDISAQEGDMVE
eukprot:TRINITY_DN28119_c0_g1_i1.p2 TRINITY_DN28119_c0_g1~~TRINITY_DN28119_c0_g1_i1.p2  ORF type:complete len:112 (-),score=12.62 TRINITY_DN28119_c0_g1_i1:182-517(-)